MIALRHGLLCVGFALAAAPAWASNAQANAGPQPGNITIGLKPAYAIDSATPMVMDMTVGPDGRQYFSIITGTVIARDPNTGKVDPFLNMGFGGANLPLPTGSANGFFGFAFHPDFSDPSKPGYRKIYTWGDERRNVSGTGGALTGLPDFWHTEQYTPGSPTPTVSNYSKATFGIFNVLREWTVFTDFPPWVVDTRTSRVLLRAAHPALSGHNGAPPRFGPDGYLYFSIGDGGGSGNDYSGNVNSTTDGHTNNIGNGQDLTTIFGKVLRIDPIPSNLGGVPSANGQYRIPGDNPFVDGLGSNGGGTAPIVINASTTANMNGVAAKVDEIYAYGFRNPWKLSFDDQPGGDGKLYLANVGQHHREEIEVIVRGGNHGWPYREGSVPLIGSDSYSGEVLGGGAVALRTPPGGYANFTSLPPLAEYKTRRQYAPDGAAAVAANLVGDGTAVIVGHVYRGAGIPALVGKLVFGDYSIAGTPPAGMTANRGRLFYLDPTEAEPVIYEFAYAPGTIIPAQLLGFGQDGAGELYALFDNGHIRQLVGPPLPPVITGATGNAQPVLSGTAAPGGTVTVSLAGTGALGNATVNSGGHWTFAYTGAALASGTKIFTAVANDAGGTSGVSGDFFWPVGPGALFHDWAAAQIANPVQRGLLDTPAGDRLPNLLKFVFALEPATPMLSPAVIGSALVDGSIFPTITFVRRLAEGLGDITSQVQASSSPAFTDSLGVVLVSVTPNGDRVTETVVARSAISLAAQPRQFLCVTATVPSE